MKLAIIAIGPPASGKTTVLQPLAERYNLGYVNRDDIRKELLGTSEDQSQNQRVWTEANRRTIAALRDRNGVVLDSTFVEKRKRKEALALVRAYGATVIIGVVATITFEEVAKRNKNRDRIVPNEALEELFTQFLKNPPTLDEGFDLLIPL